ncbi:rhodanese-like domain-containing protein [Clostridium estertheticum]|uniref:rhodanese-like domain-containing protein n=1 Tax=Clostridium estertheticum TaxID=238834 RepID=UPI001CF13995|nr:rhodanese-like domain-containing protein [Clostridium estertheticum]MCB2305115.1 rhodanese-like domain-containing protein [Clostridium estertheticum]MCB2343615.1 rhodanese-like domain-containing protein [Clostridium estertheticum]MCB2348535.1 rhodanese-like domain-containing protein [Clostridium estertheticum]WAG47479.1 rhodanese-like domain-containing protein [Clostridium estertheticum]
MFNSGVKNVSVEEAYKLINEDKEFIIIDVRTKEEYDNGHIPGAKLVPVQILPMKLDELGVYKDKPVLVYCASGGRSPRAVDTLANNDFKNIYHLSHGIGSWRYSLSR